MCSCCVCSQENNTQPHKRALSSSGPLFSYSRAKGVGAQSPLWREQATCVAQLSFPLLSCASRTLSAVLKKAQVLDSLLAPNNASLAKSSTTCGALYFAGTNKCSGKEQCCTSRDGKSAMFARDGTLAYHTQLSKPSTSRACVCANSLSIGPSVAPLQNADLTPSFFLSLAAGSTRLAATGCSTCRHRHLYGRTI